MALMEIKQLKTYYFTPEGTVRAVDGVSLKLEKGQALGLVGESGCGKTTVALSAMKLLPSNARITGGEIMFNGENLAAKTDDEMNKIRWKKMSLIFQGAMNALNPVFKVGDQIVEAITTHNRNMTKERGEKENTRATGTGRSRPLKGTGLSTRIQWRDEAESSNRDGSLLRSGCLSSGRTDNSTRCHHSRTNLGADKRFASQTRAFTDRHHTRFVTHC